jgi:hypothetical protein
MVLQKNFTLSRNGYLVKVRILLCRLKEAMGTQPQSFRKIPLLVLSMSNTLTKKSGIPRCSHTLRCDEGFKVGDRMSRITDRKAA